MGLTAPPSLSNTLPATPAVSQAWTDPSSPRCPCRHRCRPNPTNPPKPPGGDAATVPPAHPTTRPFTSALQMKCATVASASPTCPRTMTTRRCRCRCPRSEAPCWGRRSEVGLLNSTPTPAPSAPKCDHPLLSNEKRRKKKENSSLTFDLYTHRFPCVPLHTPAPPLTQPLNKNKGWLFVEIPLSRLFAEKMKLTIKSSFLYILKLYIFMLTQKVIILRFTVD